MFYREIAKTLGAYLYFLGASLIIPLLVAITFEFILHSRHHPQPHSTFAFLITVVFCFILGWLLRRAGRQSQGTLYRREGLALVVIIWFLTSFIGALPFYLSGTLDNPVDAYFEATS